MGKIKDRKGNRVHKLLVISLHSTNPVRWNCLCDCGNTKVIRGSNLSTKQTKSCGCLDGGVTHGMKHTKIYNVWAAMIQRCSNPNNKDYTHYGGRGITVCERWLKFENFYTDMGDIPTRLELDRIDNNSGYSKDNCRWVTHQDNLLNRRR